MDLELVIGQHVQAVRKARGWTLEELAEALNKPETRTTWTRQTVSAAEHGRRHWAVADLFNVAQTLGVSVGDLTRATETVNIGGLTVEPADVRVTFNSAATLREARLARANLYALANVLRDLTSVYREGVANFRAQYGDDTDVMREVRRDHDATRKRVRRQLNAVIKTERGTPPVVDTKTHEDRLAEYGFLEVPEIRVGNDILKEQKR